MSVDVDIKCRLSRLKKIGYNEKNIRELFFEELCCLLQFEKIVNSESFDYKKDRDHIFAIGEFKDWVGFHESINRFRMTCGDLCDYDIYKFQTSYSSDTCVQDDVKSELESIWESYVTRFDLLEEKLINLELDFASNN